MRGQGKGGRHQLVRGVYVCFSKVFGGSGLSNIGASSVTIDNGLPPPAEQGRRFLPPMSTSVGTHMELLDILAPMSVPVTA